MNNPNRPLYKGPTPFLALLGVAWLLAVGAGFWTLWIYKMTPGAQGHAIAAQWPRQSRLPPPAGRFTLALFAHPGCACTRATISELAGLLARFHDRLEARVVFIAVPGGEDPSGSDLWSSAARIPGVTMVRDDSGTETARFGAVTSGTAVLYDAEGRLRFSGGITPARGHQGDSFGRRRVASILSGEAPDRADAPVFGCALEANELAARITRADPPGSIEVGR
jgi:hypothetical protein